MSEHVEPEELSAHLDGDLDSGREREIEAHLEACEACRRVAAEIGQLKGGLAALGAVEPGRDLWPGVQAALAPRTRSWWRRFWMLPVAAAAGAAAAILVALLLGRSAIEPAPRTEPAGALQALQAVAQAEIQYRKAIDALSGALGAQRSRVGPQTRALIVRGLAEIDATIERCRAALAEDPFDLEAQETMLAAYQHEVDLLTDMVAESL
ncbi:MAG: zf-HC2 domain-containing protein [Deltaproteobacteria bacterium]|nr:zf-HC2 domain-containing protein [Deltaproteobacteria bacterium]